MVFRICIVLAFLVCFVPYNANATCAGIGSSAQNAADIVRDLVKKMKSVELKIKNRIQTASEHFVDATQAASNADTSGKQMLAKTNAAAHDANNAVATKRAKEEKLYEAVRETKPTINDCISITPKVHSGQQMQYLTEAATTALDRVAIADFTNDAGSPYSKGVTSALALQFSEFIDLYCDGEANNGYMPGLNGVPAVNYGGTNISCGDGRSGMATGEEGVLINADINIGSIMFGKTWPQDYSDMILAAAHKQALLLGPSPRDPFNPSALSGDAGIKAFMERRSFEARSSLVHSNFNYISAKRLPTTNGGGSWMKAMMAKELSPNRLNIRTPEEMDTHCSTNSDEECGMWRIVQNIPDNASKSEFMDFLMRDRFLGTEYYISNSANNRYMARRQQIDLLTLDLIQQREINETVERILGTIAAKYALRVDQMASASTIGSAK